MKFESIDLHGQRISSEVFDSVFEKICQHRIFNRSMVVRWFEEAGVYRRQWWQGSHKYTSQAAADRLIAKLKRAKVIYCALGSSGAMWRYAG